MRKFLLVPAFALASMLCLMGAACNRVQEANPIAAGCTSTDGHKVDLELCAFSLYGTFVVFEKTSVKVATDLQSKAAAASDENQKAVYLKGKNAIIAADEAAKPIADSMYDAMTEYEAIYRELLAVGTSAPDEKAMLDERLLAAKTNLQSWVDRARPKIEALTAAVRGAR